MTASHHPSDELLFDYATGALVESACIAIATHLSLCPLCRSNVSCIEEIGGNLLADVVDETISSASFDLILDKLGSATPDDNENLQYIDSTSSSLVIPQPLQRYLNCNAKEIPWQRLGLGASQLVVPTKSDTMTVRLLKIPAGRRVPEHTHKGVELTLVLSGSFSDTTGQYDRGDLQEADSDLQHQPRADNSEDCICLAVTEAPLQFTGLATRIIQPILGI